MKNKKIFISIILFVTILLISTICHASQVSYDISDYNNYIDGKVYAIVYSKENDCIYLILGDRIFLGVDGVETDYLWSSSNKDACISGDFHARLGGITVYTYNISTKKFEDMQSYGYQAFKTGKDTQILASNTNVGNADNISTLFFQKEPENNTVSVEKERGTTDSGSTDSGSGNVENTTGDNTNTTTDFSSTGVFSWIAKGLSDVINFLKSIISGVGNLATSLGEWFGSLFTNLDNGFTNSDISMKNFFAGIPEFFSNFWENFVNFLKGLFIPSEERLTAISDSVKSKFGFVDSIKISIDTIKDNITGTDSKAIINVTTKPTKYTDEMKVKIIDFSWYAPFKPYGDLVITGFCYAMFIWRLFMKLPGIIHGTSASVEPFNDVKNYYSGGGKR